MFVPGFQADAFQPDAFQIPADDTDAPAVKQGPAGGPDYRYGRSKGEDEKDEFRKRLYAELQRHMEGAQDAEQPQAVARHVRKAKNIAARSNEGALATMLARMERDLRDVRDNKIAQITAEGVVRRVQYRIAQEQERIRQAKIAEDDDDVMELLLLH